MKTTYKRDAKSGDVTAFLSFMDIDGLKKVRLGVLIKPRGLLCTWVWAPSPALVARGGASEWAPEMTCPRTSLRAAKSELEARLYIALTGARDWTDMDAPDAVDVETQRERVLLDLKARPVEMPPLLTLD